MASKYDVAHNWAHQLKKKLTSGNFWFEGSRIFSYSTVIGQIITLENGNTIYILNDKHYSSSTSKHTSAMGGAIPGNANVFHLTPNDAFIYGWRGVNYYSDDFPESAKMNWIFRYVRFIYQTILEYKDSKSTKLDANAEYLKAFREIQRFLQITGATTMRKLLRLTNAEWKMYEFRKDQGITLARKALKILNEQGTREELVDAVCGAGTYQSYLNRTERIRRSQETYRNNAAARQAERERVASLSEKERILEKIPEPLRTEINQRIEAGDRSVYRDLYHLGYINSVPYHYNNNSDIYRGGNVLMRLKKGVVETTKGMRVSVDECKRLWKLITRWHNNQSSFQPGEVAKTNGYVTGWAIRGYLHDILYAGCHSIAYDEMKELAVVLGLVEA
ncbi:MAG: hypothetical protein IKQ20_03520 [Bacteroidales bacterium]|nr:hypothetical protein [Bacteroidales bacterium]